MIIEIDLAVKKLLEGDVVALPTETVYGLAAIAEDPAAIQKVFLTKGRPQDNPLIVHLEGVHQISNFTREPSEAVRRLMKVFWPGPLTIILPKHPNVSDLITAGLDSVALRVPAHAMMLKILKKTGPLVAPSANPSGMPSPTKAIHVEQDYDGQISVVDGGSTQIGLESTVIDCRNENEFVILRPGALDAVTLSQTAQLPVRYWNEHSTQEESHNKPSGTGITESSNEDVSSDGIRSPGMKYSHYKPKAAVYWVKSECKPNGRLKASLPDDTLLILHSAGEPEHFSGRIIHVKGDFSTMAALIYDLFRWADRIGLHNIYIESLPEDHLHPLLPALKNRISRAIGMYS